MTSARPTIKFSTIISVANMVSRASVGLLSPFSMTEAISDTSMTMIDSVRTSVP
jgi:hypothetical protein